MDTHRYPYRALCFFCVIRASRICLSICNVLPHTRRRALRLAHPVIQTFVEFYSFPRYYYNILLNICQVFFISKYRHSKYFKFLFVEAFFILLILTLS